LKPAAMRISFTRSAISGFVTLPEMTTESLAWLSWMFSFG